MSAWTDGSVINDKALDNLTESELDQILKILENVK
jgi:hypothetical protein